MAASRVKFSRARDPGRGPEAVPQSSIPQAGEAGGRHEFRAPRRHHDAGVADSFRDPADVRGDQARPQVIASIRL